MTTHDDAIALNYRQGYYNACDGKGWQKQKEGLSVQDSEARDASAWAIEKDRRTFGACLAFAVGQCISTLAEYEALPVGATVWPMPADGQSWWWTKHSNEFTASDDGCFARDCDEMGRHARVIRSLP